MREISTSFVLRAPSSLRKKGIFFIKDSAALSPPWLQMDNIHEKLNSFK